MPFIFPFISLLLQFLLPHLMFLLSHPHLLLFPISTHHNLLRPHLSPSFPQKSWTFALIHLTWFFLPLKNLFLSFLKSRFLFSLLHDSRFCWKSSLTLVWCNNLWGTKKIWEKEKEENHHFVSSSSSDDHHQVTQSSKRAICKSFCSFLLSVETRLIFSLWYSCYYRCKRKKG